MHLEELASWTLAFNIRSAGEWIYLAIGLALVLIVVFRGKSKSKECALCKTSLYAGAGYRERVNGKKKTVCFDCHEDLEKRRSKDAADRVQQ